MNHEKNAALKPTDAELDILQIVWTNGPSTVREVHEHLLELKDVRYTTVLRQMQILEEKGFVKSDKGQRSHIFSVAIPQEKIQDNLVSHLLNHAFSGSQSQLLMRALGSKKADKEELDAMRALIDSYEKEQL